MPNCRKCGEIAVFRHQAFYCSERCARAQYQMADSGDMERLTVDNEDYRRVISTTQQLQVVLMSITREDGGIPRETHPHTTQFIRVEAGEGVALVEGETIQLHDGTFFVVPAGASHELLQTGEQPLKLYSIYAPPEHPHNLVQKRVVR